MNSKFHYKVALAFFQNKLSQEGPQLADPKAKSKLDYGIHLVTKSRLQRFCRSIVVVLLQIFGVHMVKKSFCIFAVEFFDLRVFFQDKLSKGWPRPDDHKGQIETESLDATHYKIQITTFLQKCCCSSVLDLCRAHGQKVFAYLLLNFLTSVHRRVYMKGNQLSMFSSELLQ